MILYFGEYSAMESPSDVMVNNLNEYFSLVGGDTIHSMLHQFYLVPEKD